MDAHTHETANQRFKARGGERTRLAMIGAVVFHLAVLTVVQPLPVDAVAAAAEAELEVVLPTEITLPEPLPPIARPATPIVGAVDIDPGATIPITGFDDVPDLPVRPPRVEADPNAVRFIPHDTPPRLLNGDEVGVALRAEYPQRLRRSGVEGRVLLWLYVETDGSVTRSQVMTSSGSAELDEAAVRVARGMRFAPARNRDRETAVWVQQWIDFRIR